MHNDMHRALTLALVVFIGALTGAGATSQPTKSSVQTDPISYTAAGPHLNMLFIIPRASRGVVSEVNTCLGRVPAPSNCGLRMAQYSCAAGCNMVYQNGAAQCEFFRAVYDQYRACMAQAQQNAQACKHQCDSGTLPPAGNTPFCQQYPSAACCRAGTC
jgi:hypothetical protein